MGGAAAVPMQYISPTYPQMYEVHYYQYPVPGGAAEVKPPSTTATYALPPGYSAYPYTIPAHSSKPAEAMHYPRASTIAYIASPSPHVGYAYPPGVVSYASGIPSAYVRSDERRVGKECVSTCKSRGSPEHKKKKK